MKSIHEAGFTYNDLRPSNIMLTNGRVTLIDFGMAKPYLSKCDHLEQTVLTEFSGNLIFSSQYQMDFKSTSRRDDLISIFYVLMWLLCDQTFIGLNLPNENASLKYKFHTIKTYKINTTLEKMAILFRHKNGHF